MQIFVFLFGLCVGSFANVLIDRLPRGEDVLRGRSRCDFCKKTLRWFELMPIVSFLLQGGCCRRCHGRLSLQYPIVELVVGIGFVLLYQHAGDLLIFLSLLVIFVADLKYEIVPDSMVGIGLLGSLLQGDPLRGWQGVPFWISAFGAAAFFFFLYVLTRGRGMGFGDVKLVFLLGLLLGFPNIVVALYVAFLTGAAVGVILIVGGKKKLKSHLPFGPFLISGAAVTFFWGNQIVDWWRKLL